jgi:hypothetical protein
MDHTWLIPSEQCDIQMGSTGDDVAQAMGAVQAKVEEVHSLQNKMQADLTATIDGE